MQIDKFFEFIIHLDNLLKLLLLILLCKKVDLSIRSLRVFHIVPQQCHPNFSVCSVHYVNYLVSQFELFIHGFGHCRYKHWGQVSFPVCNDQLIPQSHKLVEICFSHGEILDQSELVNFIFFFEKFEFCIQVVGIILDQKNRPYLSWHLPKSTYSVHFRLSKEAVVL